MTSYQLDLQETPVHLAQQDLQAHPAHLAHLGQVLLVALLTMDLELVAMDRFYTDHVDLQGHQDSQDPRVTWDFQELWVQMERWVHRVSKVFQELMDHQDLVEQAVPVD